MLLPLRLCVWWQSTHFVLAAERVQVVTAAQLAGCEVLTLYYTSLPPEGKAKCRGIHYYATYAFNYDIYYSKQ